MDANTGFANAAVGGFRGNVAREDEVAACTVPLRGGGGCWCGSLLLGVESWFHSVRVGKGGEDKVSNFSSCFCTAHTARLRTHKDWYIHTRTNKGYGQTHRKSTVFLSTRIRILRFLALKT